MGLIFCEIFLPYRGDVPRFRKEFAGKKEKAPGLP